MTEGSVNQLFVLQVDGRILYKIGSYEQIKEKYPDASWIDVVDKVDTNEVDFTIPMSYEVVD